MRDALSLLDQAIAHGAGQVDEAQVRDMLGTVDLDYLFAILEALLADDVAAMLAVADDMALRSLSFGVALQELAALLTRVQVAQLAPQTVPEELPERARLLDVAARFDPEFVQLAYQIAVHGRQELPLAPDEQTGFTMTLLRLHTFRPQAAGEGGGQRIPPTAAPRAARPATPSAVAPASVASAAPVPPVAPPAQHVPSAADTAPPQSSAPSLAANEPLPAALAADADWLSIVGGMKIGAMARELAQNCLLRRVNGTRIVLSLAPAQRHLLIKTAQDKLQQALSEYHACPVQLTIEIEDVVGETPAAVAHKERQERQAQAEESIDQDEFVREAVALFDAKVVEDTTRPF